MNSQTIDTLVRATITVEASQARAFETFVNMGAWWPLESHHIGEVQPKSTHIEPRQGGRLYEVGIDGSECDWGRVLAYEPPAFLKLDWQINADWKSDPSFHSPVEIKFIAEGPNRTRVELSHDVAAFGERAAEVRSAIGSQGGWPGLLERFAKAAKS